LKKFAIITAGGTGERMNSSLPKQFIQINGKEIIFHTIDAFLKAEPSIEILVTLPKKYFPYWNDKASSLNDYSVKLIEGGSTRFNSIKNALESISNESGLVAIHDAVRPLIDSEIIINSYTSAMQYGSGVTCIPLRDSIRKIVGSESELRNRQDYVLMQTPQTFNLEMILAAYKNTDSQDFTDDAGVWESAGRKVNLIEGSHKNIKITFQEDIEVLKTLIQ
jgi:2-C-methyl-D-erythritol 4-phosphate cytidylyltransferase